MEQSKHTETIRDLIATARDIDRQVEQLAKSLHLAQTGINQELDAMRDVGVLTDTVEDDPQLWPWYQETGILEVRAVASAMGERLNAAIDQLRPGNMLPAVRRAEYTKYGIGGFAIDPYREPEAVTA